MVEQALATIALGLLGASGVAKLIDPDPTTGAMRAAHIPSSNLLTYLLGLVEVISSVLALTVGGIAVAVAGVLYLGFLTFTFAAVRNRIPVQSCGCFGRDDTPPNAVHVAFNFLALVSLAALVSAGNPAVIDWSLPLVELTIYLTFGAVGVSASYLVLARLPQLMALTESS